MSDTTFQFDETARIGDDHPVVISFYDEDDDGVLTPEEIDDRDWFYTAKTSNSLPDDDALIQLDNITADADPDLTLNPDALINRLSFFLPKADTILATERNYEHDIQSVETSSGRVFTKAQGQLSMVTHSTIRTA
jgi:sugar/nucleoside kinase (ribokinase family)